MKILYISPRYQGGIGGHAFRVAEKLRQQGHDVKLMQIPHIPIKKLKNPSFTIFGILKSFSNREKYDAVHAWNIPSAFIMKYVNSNKKIHNYFLCLKKSNLNARFEEEKLDIKCTRKLQRYW